MAVLVVVVLALTGFQPAASGGRGSRGHGKSGGSSSGGSGGGGGCSSPRQGNGGSHSGSGSGSGISGQHRDDSTDSSGSGSSSGPVTDDDGVRAEVVSCVRKAQGKRKAVTYATVRVVADEDSPASETYDIDVTFKDAAGAYVDYGDAEVTLAGGETRTVRVPMDTPRKVTRVRQCAATATVEG